MKTTITILISLIIQQLCIGQCPSIKKQPSSQIDCEGNSIRMMIETDATSILWERKKPTDATFASISGANTYNFQIYPSGGSTNPDGTIYRAKLTTGSCTIYSDEASIGLNTITNITGTSICERSDGFLQVNIPENSKNRARTFQWISSKNGEPFQNIVDGSEFEGTQTGFLKIKNAGLQHQGQKFKVRIDFAVSPDNDNDGSTNNSNQTATCPRTSNEVSLTIKTAPSPNHSVESYKACVGTSISVSSTGCSPYSTLWYDEQKRKVGEGARSSILFPNAGNQLVFATCLKNGCESIPSKGVEIIVNEIPKKVVNTETPTKVKAGENIIFKASGGINNIWYLKENDSKYISTASTLTIKNSQVESNQPYISRWVSQKINGCESEKIEIKVFVESSIIPEPVQPEPQNPPIPNPEPNPEPPIPSPIPEPIPEPIPTPLPVIQDVDLYVQKNCDRELYTISSTNCPSNVDFYEAENNQYLGYCNADKAFELDARWYRKIKARCNSAYFTEIYKEFADLKNPEIRIIQKQKERFCSGDTMQIKSSINYPADFLHWEKNGHIYATAKELVLEADSTQYAVLYRKNDCYYRHYAQPIKVYPKPSKPLIKFPKKSFCPGEKLVVQTEEKAHKYLWSNQIQEESNLVTDNITLTLVVQNEFQCQSEDSDPVTFTRLPKGEKPIISTTKIQFCEGDTVQIESNLKEQTIWSNGKQSSFIHANDSGDFFAFTKSPEGCLSDYSETIRIYKRANPKPPKIIQPFNRVFQGITEATDDFLEWRMNEQLLQVQHDELRLHKPTNFDLNSVKKYTLRGANDLFCISEKISYHIKEIDPYKEMVVYPNPSKNFEVQINTPIDFERGILYLIDLNGHIVFEEAIRNKFNPIRKRFTAINPGIYILRIVSEQWIGEKRIFLIE